MGIRYNGRRLARNCHFNYNLHFHDIKCMRTLSKPLAIVPSTVSTQLYQAYRVIVKSRRQFLHRSSCWRILSSSPTIVKHLNEID